MTQAHDRVRLLPSITIQTSWVLLASALLLPVRLTAQEVVHTERLLRSSGTLTDRLLAGEVPGASGVFGRDFTERGVALRRDSGEGKVEVIEAGGRYAAGMVDSKIEGAHYYYFKLAEKPKAETVDISVEYFDAAEGTVTLSYDGAQGGFMKCPEIQLTGGHTWNLIVFRIPDGKWTGGCNGADFRIGNAPAGFAIGAVAVRAV